jgi:putative methionine-R-sulfoxide reductase with GAF domain
MYDPGTTLEVENTKSVLDNSIIYVKKASSFVKAITSGDYNVTWSDASADATIMQQDNLAGDLLKMRNKMKEVKSIDEKRMWSTEGLAKFSEVARNNQNNIENLANEVINFLNKYLKAQQGSIFILKDDTGEEPYLELTACYAFDRKKYLQKKVPLGAGLVGQAYLEQHTRVLVDVPKGYLAITSGLGDAAPSCIIIVPMKANEKVEAVLELASFKPFEPHVVEFLEKAGEVFASAIATTKVNHRTSKLLSETQQQAEILKAQEEELRQNMEEMQATQEAVRRDALESK